MTVDHLRERIETVYRECWELARSVVAAREQIATLRPNKLRDQSLPRAKQEIDEIVAATEVAANTIMEAAEEIVAADRADPKFQETVNGACTRIFEACAFQDITGQRISRILTMVQQIDEHLAVLQGLLGPVPDAEDETPDVEEQWSEESLLNGPAMSGEGIDQNAIDTLFD